MERAIPKDGCSILLMEKPRGQRTYTDCDDVQSSLFKLLDIFEKVRAADELDDKNYTLPDVEKWLDEFDDIQLMILDKEINRYKRVDADGLKKLLLDYIQEAMNSDV